jgi:cystathionine beta-lyase/cystathionine gamma-synthase
VDRLAQERADLVDVVRTLLSPAAAAATAADWQSPSFGHSVFAQAGRFAGRITEHHDDYRRDRHADASGFEDAYLREYVDHPAGMDLRALMTSCGMSAFTTVLSFLTMEGPAPRRVLAGRSLYHECRELLRRCRFGTALVEVDEDDTEGLLRAIDATHPGAIFLDALCNERAMALPDLPRLIGHLASRPEPATLVLDTTGLSCTIQPFAILPEGARHVRILAVESLTKYPQFGLDRTPAGMIVAPQADASRLDAYREHLGTNVSDAAPFLVPEPSRAALERRLARIGRNAVELAGALSKHVGGKASTVVGASHPGLPGHAAWPRARVMDFPGGYFAVRFSPPEDTTVGHRRFVRAVLESASERGVPIVAGASFGFDVTRIYVTASDAQHGAPFVRIAAGTEHRLGLESLKAVLREAADRVPGRRSTTAAGVPARFVRDPTAAPA